MRTCVIEVGDFAVDAVVEGLKRLLVTLIANATCYHRVRIVVTFVVLLGWLGSNPTPHTSAVTRCRHAHALSSFVLEREVLSQIGWQHCWRERG